MMMKKHIFLTLLLIVAQGAWLQVIGGNSNPKVLDSPPTEGPWTFDAVITHSASNVSTLSFNGANRNTWQDYNGTDELEHTSHSKVYQWQDGEGLGFTICAKSIEGESFGVLSTYFHREGVPSYTRYRLRWTYTLKSRTDNAGQGLGQCIALYTNESLDDIKNLVVNLDENYGHETEEGRAHAVSHFVLLKDNSKEETERRTLFLDLDNRDGATDQTKEKALMAVYSVQKGFHSYNEYAVVSIHQWTSFKSYDLVREAYYYKYLTFNANGGVGTMSGQEIENSGKLNTARFARTGYTFQGWAKTPNGAVVYADGAEITATEADKGPVTLYAVWKANPANVVAMINTIGEVVCTAECKARIDAARAVYDALSAEDKALVTNYSVLQAAENTYAAVKDVVTKINAIGSVSYPGSGTAITTAQTAYEALTAEQKAIVINVGVLRTAQDQYAVLGVANQISAIGDVAYTSESKTLIDAARTAYDALSAGQKTLVSNYGTLTAAETTYQQAKEDVGNTTINFVDKDDATLRNQKTTLNYPAAPEVTDYVFQYWQAMEGSLSGGVLLVKAVYAPFGGNITLSEADDNSTWIATNNGQVYNVTLTRTLQTGGWNTFAVPFGINPVPTGWTVKKLTDAITNGSTLTLTFESETMAIEAGKPYLVKVESAVANPTFNGVTISNSTTPTTFSGVVSFVPVINPTAMTANDMTKLFVTGGNKLTHPSADGNINGFRAYFQLLDANARSFVLDLGDETTGLEMMSDGRGKMSDVWYDMQGQKLQGKPTAKGVYILNGKKIVIK